MLTTRDASLKLTRALPNGAATVTSTGLQIKNDSGEFNARTEVLIEAPATSTVGDAATIKYSIMHGDASDFSDAAILAADVLTQTGAGGTGVSAATARFAIPSTVKKYIGIRAVKSGAGDATGVSVTLRLLF